MDRIWELTEADLLEPPMPLQKRKIIWVDTEAAVLDMVNTLDALPKNSQSVFVNLEGVDFTREDPISIIDVYDSSAKCSYVMDIYALGYRCFSLAGRIVAL